jgi:hypothetical protein
VVRAPLDGSAAGGSADGGAADGGAADGGAADGGAADGGAPDTGGPAPEAPQLRILTPTDGALVSNPVTFTLEGNGITEVRIEADGWELDRWDPAAAGWSTTYTFSGVGYPREVRAEGLGADGAVLAEDRATITIEAPAPDPGVVLDVPYFYQYDNRYEPGATCGLTSTAMVLSSWGLAVDPDTLYVRYGKAQGQSPTGILEIYEAEGLEGEAGWTATRSELRALLDAGQPVIVHGWWTSAGHIVVLVGYDDAGWITNDPAGDWEVCYGCGSGEGVRYAYGGGWDDALGADGDIWWSSARP